MTFSHDWIAAHAMPEGEGIAGQHGRKGYLMLINILLRPSLMVIGFFLSIVLISVFSQIALMILASASITNLMDTDAYWSFSGVGLLGMLLSFVGGLVIIGVTLTIIIHKSLGLVTWLPENVIKWAGGDTGASLGENSDERRVAALIGGVGQTQKMSGDSGREGGDPDGDDNPTPSPQGGGGKGSEPSKNATKQATGQGSGQESSGGSSESGGDSSSQGGGSQGSGQGGSGSSGSGGGSGGQPSMQGGKSGGEALSHESGKD